MTLPELAALSEHIAQLRASGAKGTLHAEIKAFAANLKRGTHEEPCAECGGPRSAHHGFVAATVAAGARRCE